MKKTGRGASYRAALTENLVKNLLTYKKIQTTRSRSKQIIEQIRKRISQQVTVRVAPARRGDNARQVTLEIKDLEKEKGNVAHQHKTKSDTKNMASR